MRSSSVEEWHYSKYILKTRLNFWDTLQLIQTCSTLGSFSHLFKPTQLCGHSPINSNLLNFGGILPFIQTCSTLWTFSPIYSNLLNFVDILSH